MIDEQFFEIAAQLIELIDNNQIATQNERGKKQSILVFLPGIEEINLMIEHLDD